VHQVRDWYSGGPSRTCTNAYFGWMREVKRENTRCGLRPMSDKAAGRKTRGPKGCDENGPAAALLLGHVSIQICSLFPPVRLGPPCRRPILIATPLYQSRFAYRSPQFARNDSDTTWVWALPTMFPRDGNPVRISFGGISPAL